MNFLLLSVFAAMAGYIFFQLPRDIWKKKLPAVLVVLLNIVGFGCLFMLLFGVYRMPDGFLREIIIWIGAVYYVRLISFCAIMFLRQINEYIFLHMRNEKLFRFFHNKMLIWGIAWMTTILYLIGGYLHANDLQLTEYEVTLPVVEGYPTDAFSIALISDLHVGAGADHHKMDQMVQLINEADCDLICVAGDFADSTSSTADIQYLIDSFAKINATYGIYYVSGNHESDCRFPVLDDLNKAGYHDISERAEMLPNGVAIVGRTIALKKNLPELLAAGDVDPRANRIILQHIPKQFDYLADECNILMCGHTHGYALPYNAIINPTIQDSTEGLVQKGKMTAITTSGISAWGIRFKWPSNNEVVKIHVTYQ